MPNIDLPAKTIKIQYSRYRSSHFYDASSGKQNDGFGFLVQGRVTFRTPKGSMEFEAGDLFYIPDGFRYQSFWQGAPDVEFYAIQLGNSGKSPSRFGFSAIPSLSGEDTLNRMRQIYALSRGSETEKMRSAAMVMELYAEAMKELTPREAPVINPALLAAIDYIKNNYSRDFAMQELADHCHLSESRLYHLFREELDTSPVGYRNDLRVERAAYLLRRGGYTTEDILGETGFHSSTYFREIFRGKTGMTPRNYARIVQEGYHSPAPHPTEEAREELALVQLLTQKGLTVATAESCTGGLIAKRITDVPGASRVFVGGGVTYTNEMKMKLLGVPEELIKTHTEVSREVASAMAGGARLHFGTDVAIATTGFAGPGGGTDRDPVGTVYVGISTAKGDRVLRLALPSDRSREFIRSAAASHALAEAFRMINEGV